MAGDSLGGLERATIDSNVDAAVASIGRRASEASRAGEVLECLHAAA